MIYTFSNLFFARLGDTLVRFKYYLNYLIILIELHNN